MRKDGTNVRSKLKKEAARMVEETGLKPAGDENSLGSSSLPASVEKESGYLLWMTREQVAVTRKALEVYARLLHGQFGMVLQDAFMDRYCDIHHPEFNHDLVVDVERQLKIAIFPELNQNASYGVGSRVYPESTEAWQLMTVLRHRLAWDRLREQGEGEANRWSVDYGEPMSYNGGPLAAISSVGEPDKPTSHPGPN
jgi:hypothetical protein